MMHLVSNIYIQRTGSHLPVCVWYAVGLQMLTWSTEFGRKGCRLQCQLSVHFFETTFKFEEI